MATRIIFFVLLFSFTICVGTFGQRARVIEIYTIEIGVRETTGNNDGPDVEKYQASTGLNAKNFAWCAAFVNWVYLEGGVAPPKSPAWSPSWFPDSRVVANEHGLQGDVFGIYFKSKGRIAHVGFLDEDFNNDKNVILTVEGNTNEAGSREGDGVYRKRRSKNQIYKVSCWYEINNA